LSNPEGFKLPKLMRLDKGTNIFNHVLCNVQRDPIVVLKKILKVAWIRIVRKSLSEIQNESMPPCGIFIILLNWNVKKNLETKIRKIEGKHKLT